MHQYLLLIRLPNVFTTPSNILAGYFATTPPAEANVLHLVPLMVSSGLLYIAGITLNDYFDFETDRRERPSRPLPSGRVPRKHAMVVALVAMIAANAILLLAIGPIALAVSIALTATIIAYDYRLKHADTAGPFAMGGTRFLNVILGASPSISAALLGGDLLQSETVIFAAASLFVYVVAISLLSKKEVGGEKPGLLPFYMIFVLIAGIAATGLLLFSLQMEFLINLVLLAAVISITFRQYIRGEGTSQPVQKAIGNMIVSIIVLDSVFISGIAGLSYGLATMLFIIPAVVTAKRLYMT